jgi:glutathione synthase/RimK-type ligase-like ATP-grasp enzyme
MTKITFLRDKSLGEPSCSRLVRKLNEMSITLTKTDRFSDDLADTDILIRWGNTSNFEQKPGCVVFNKASSIKLGCNKKESRRMLQEHGVSVPKSYFSKEEILSSPEIKYPLIGRPKHHTQGRNIEFIKNKNDVLNSQSEYWSEYIQKDREYRVYVFGGWILGIVRKMPKNINDVAWNSHLGAEFIDTDYRNENYCIIEESIKATNVIGQYFSAIDLMTRGNKVYVLELNSSMALSNPHRVEIFALAMKYTINYVNNFHQLPYNKENEVLHPMLCLR